MKRITHFIFLFLCWVKTQVSAQVVDKEIVVEKERAIELPPANKSFEKIQPIQTQKIPRTLLYNPTEPFLQIAPLRIQIEPDEFDQDTDLDELALPPLYKGYIKGGYGNFRTSYLKAFWQHRPLDNLIYSVEGQHLASRFGEVADEYSGTSENLIRGYGKYFLDNSVLKLEAGYRRNVNRFYAFDPAVIENLDQDSLKQVFQRYHLLFKHQSTDTEAPLSYHWGIDLKRWSDRLEASEIQAGVLGELAYRLSDPLSIQAKAQFYYMRPEDSVSLSRNYVQLRPTLRFQSEVWNLEAGFNFNYEDDTLNSEDDVHLYPVLRASYQLSGLLNIYVGLEGGIQRTSLDNFNEQNSFLASNVQLRHTNQLWEAQGGVKLNIGKNFMADVNARLGRYENLPFFINSPSDSSRFAILYEEEASNVFRLEGQLNYSLGQKYRFHYRAAWYAYDLETLEEPWHRPRLEMNWLASFSPIENLFLNADLWILTNLEAQNFTTGEQRELDNILDLSLKAEYLFFNNFSAYLSVNNIINQSYERYLYYPRQGINYLIGVTYAF